MNKSKFKLERSPKKKGTCPQCKKANVFRYYENLDRAYGICDRANNCGYHNAPGKEAVPVESKEKKEKPVKTIYPNATSIKNALAGIASNFHQFCSSHQHLLIPADHLLRWNIGTINEYTAYIYRDIDQKFVNIVHINYGKNGKRNKQRIPFSLKAGEGSKYRLCLFGEHLLDADKKKIVCLVESEKTAVIASHFYPQFDWLATGGTHKLTDEKIHVLYGREIYYLDDADKAGRDNSTIKKLKAYKQNFKIISLYPDRTDGYDLADALIDGKRPEITPGQTIEETYKNKNLSDFDKVELFLSERYEIRLNEVANEIEFRPKGANTPFEVLNENNTYIELQKAFINFSQAKVTALLRSSYVTVYNPFVDYFESLGDWTDTDTDYIEKLAGYLPVLDHDRDRLRNQLKKALVRTIACALMDNIFNKQAFVLVHEEQHSGKSTFIRWLCPPALSDYIAENISTDKDSMIALSDNFIINMDELATMNKAEINTLKAFMSKDKIKVRRPYDKKPVMTPRRASIFGSTNKMEFLSDETGSVRWICFEITGRINFNYNKDIQINDIWRQAYSLFRSGYKYDLTPEEIEENEKANSAYQIITEEQELIQKLYEPATKERHDAFVQASDIRLALSERFSFSKTSNVNIGKALKMLKFKRHSARNDKYPIKGYYVRLLYHDPNPYAQAPEVPASIPAQAPDPDKDLFDELENKEVHL